MGKESQKSALPTLFHFVRDRAAFQPHVGMQPLILILHYFHTDYLAGTKGLMAIMVMMVMPFVALVKDKFMVQHLPQEM